MQEGKVVCEEALKKKKNTRQGRKGKTECRDSEIARREKKASLNKQCKEAKESSRM